jgi:hypothetical protein
MDLNDDPPRWSGHDSASTLGRNRTRRAVKIGATVTRAELIILELDLISRYWMTSVIRQTEVSAAELLVQIGVTWLTPLLSDNRSPLTQFNMAVRNGRLFKSTPRLIHETGCVPAY